MCTAYNSNKHTRSFHDTVKIGEHSQNNQQGTLPLSASGCCGAKFCLENFPLWHSLWWYLSKPLTSHKKATVAHKVTTTQIQHTQTDICQMLSDSRCWQADHVYFIATSSNVQFQQKQLWMGDISDRYSQGRHIFCVVLQSTAGPIHLFVFSLESQGVNYSSDRFKHADSTTLLVISNSAQTNLCGCRYSSTSSYV